MAINQQILIYLHQLGHFTNRLLKQCLHDDLALNHQTLIYLHHDITNTLNIILHHNNMALNKKNTSNKYISASSNGTLPNYS